MKVFGFPTGGLVLSDPEAPKAGLSEIAFLPTVSVVPLIQHAGPSARSVVSVGDEVREGMVVGRAEAKGAANVHAPIPGKVVNSARWRMADGRESEVLVVKLGGAFDKLGRHRELFSWKGLSPHELQRNLAERGVVELDGAGRPVSEILAASRNAEEKATIVLNAVFDDDWLAADATVLKERAEAVAVGAAIAAKVAAAASVLVVVSSNSVDLTSSIPGMLEDFSLRCSTAVVSSKYPQRNFRELEYSVRSYLKSTATEGGPLLPLSPSTLAAVHDAVCFNLPLIERYVAIGGGAVKNPAVLRVRLGTRIGDAIAECGGFVEDPARLVVGSPLTGMAVYDLDTPITKMTTAIVALTAHRIGDTSGRACIGCGNCRAVCPVRLDPERLHKLSLSAKYERMGEEGAEACHGCSLCAAVCPSRLPLRATIRMGAERIPRG